MSDAPLGIDNQQIDIPRSKGVIQVPHVTPIGVGEAYGAKIKEICVLFEGIRGDGFYACDENKAVPRFSQSIVLHGFGGTRKVESTGKKHTVKHDDGFEISFPERKVTFIPPNIDTISRISKIGVLSSDVEFEGKTNPEYTEEETTGCADFNMQPRSFESILDFLPSCLHGTASDYVTKTDSSEASAVLMFAFDTSRPELAPLIQYAMKDTDPKENLWPNHIVPGQDYRIEFPVPGSGTHLAVPVGLPANYIEYIVVNEKSPYWQGERLDQLRKAAVVDGHTIPLVSIHTNKVV